MLRMYIKDYPKKWEDYLHLVEFAYNNHYQASAKLSPVDVIVTSECIHLYILCIVPRCLFQDVFVM